MCGIVGYVGLPREGQWTKTYELLEALLLSAERRGEDATGLIAATRPYDEPLAGDVVTDKLPLPASEYVEASGIWRDLGRRRCSVVLAHTRLATSGCPSRSVNNHPHVSHDARLFLLHNGVLSAVQETADRLGLVLDSDCDSELLLRIAEAEDDAGFGMYRMLREVAGTFAVTLYDRDTELVWLARCGRPLWLMQLHGLSGWLLASTRTILTDALHAVYGDDAMYGVAYIAPLSAHYVHGLAPTGELLALGGREEAV